jgi:oxygen-independent coproporphyrinogen-3 oxidase
VASNKHRGIFTSALLKEIELQKGYLGEETINTIYFGGGTPSLLSTAEIQQIIEKVKGFFNVSNDAEITLEANPDDVSDEKTAEWTLSPVNRISLGIQSFHDQDLLYLNRFHDSKTARESIETLKKNGFDNITIDLIYGIPTLTKERWIENLEFFFELGLPHLSAYALTVEDKTTLAHLISKKKAKPVNEETQVEHFEILLQLTEKKGFVHYEISNFARPGHYSKHNSIYWLGGHYLGLGPSAHSFNGRERQWNVSNLGRYISMDEITTIVEETEELSDIQRYNEYVMTSLRTIWGCDTEHIRNVFGNSYLEHITEKAKSFIADNRIRKDGNKLYLTNWGKLFADGIASELFREE